MDIRLKSITKRTHHSLSGVKLELITFVRAQVLSLKRIKLPFISMVEQRKSSFLPHPRMMLPCM
jgi:hypothetical protein